MRTEVTTIDGNVVAVEQNLTGTHLWVDGVEARGIGWEFTLPIDDAGHVWIYEIDRRRGRNVLVHQGRTYPLGPFGDRTTVLVDSAAFLGFALPTTVVFPLFGSGYVVAWLVSTSVLLLRRHQDPVQWAPVGRKLLQGVAVGLVATLAGVLVFHPRFWWT